MKYKYIIIYIILEDYALLYQSLMTIIMEPHSVRFIKTFIFLDKKKESCVELTTIIFMNENQKCNSDIIDMSGKFENVIILFHTHIKIDFIN